ncbi:MAG: acylphosphatase, partial [Desulfuromonadaceae bacterium]
MVQRKSIRIEGIVQGVGFRPFVYQLALSCGISGWVRNDSRGVLIEAEGSEAALTCFLRDLRQQHPPLASISRFESSDRPCLGETDFAIIASDAGLKKSAQVSPDTHVCNDCLGELFDSTDRRYRYPFINCTNCGPRYTIVTDIPYDRPNTTM